MKKLLLVFAFLIGMIGASAQTPFQNYGDSLNGFDEIKVRNELALYHGVTGKEYFYTAPLLKRNFINQKYGLNKPISVINTPKPTPKGPGKSLGGPNYVQVAPCVNEGFENTTPGTYTGSGNSTAISGWTISSRAVNGTCNNTNAWSAGSSKIWCVTTPITGIPGIGALGASPFGGTNVIKMHTQFTPYSLETKLAQTFPVTMGNSVFQFAYAGVWEDGTHNCCEQPKLEIKMYDCLGAPLACSNLSLQSQGINCPSGAPGYSVSGGLSYTPTWFVRYIDLTPYIGTCVTIEIINSDCIFGGHYGMVYFDAQCGGQIIGTGIPGPGATIAGPVSFCAGANQALIAAPLGYNSYQWYGPNGIIAAPQGTQTTLNVQNPVQGTTYTVVMLAASGCTFSSINTLNFTQVNIAGTQTAATCPGGASGTATVYGNGSGTGYTYTWTNSSNQVVGSNSIAINLPAGTYTIAIAGLGALGCGTQSTTVNIPSSPVPLTTLIKPYCGSTAYFSTNGGTNIQWYNNTTPVSTSTSYILSNPSNGGFVHLRYTTTQGCQDSIKYILNATTPGAITVLSNKLICPGASNGSVVIGMIPAAAAPPGFNNYSVTSTGTTNPYNISTNFSNLNTYTVTGLQANGTYTVNAFDGSCAYSLNFTVPQHVWDYTLSANAYSVCPGATIVAGINFTSQPSVGQYTYSWSPTTWLLGNNATFQNTFISPIVAPGSSQTIVYTTIVTPSISGCAITKTMAITAYNPIVPTISVIPNMCNNGVPYPILVSPQGGTFNTAPIIGGVIQPTLANIGVNTFTYAISMYTCVAKQTATYEVSQFRSSALTSTVPPLCVTSPQFNLMNIVQSTVGNWFGTGVTGTNFFNPAGLNTQNYNITYSVNSTPNPTVCPSITSINVAVTKTITPFITPVSEFCTNASSINLIVNPSGGTWGGNSAVTVGGVITPSLANVPSSTVGYSIAIGPCLNTANITLLTSKFNTANLTSTVNNLCYNSTSVNLMGVVASTINGTWSGMGVNGNVFNPSNLVTGIYTVTYTTLSSPNTQLCPDTSIINIKVSNPDQPNIVNAGPFCSNSPLTQLNVFPTNGNWQVTSCLNSTGLFNPNTAAIGNNIVTYVIGTSTCNRIDTKIIKVEAFVPSTISSPIPDLCNTSSAINLAPMVANTGGIWSGAGVIGSMFNPANVGAGTFIIKYSTSSSPSGLCPDASTIAVNVYSLTSPIITKVGPFCNTGMPIKLGVSPLGGIFGGVNSNVISLDGLFNPSQGIIGNNIINYSITSGPCIAYAQQTINIEQFVDAGFVKPIPAMCEDAFPINLNSFVQNPTIFWSGTGTTGNMFEPLKAHYGENKVYHYTYSSPTTTLCPDVDSTTIFVKEIPKIVAISNRTSGCSPVEVILNVPNTNSGNSVWHFGDGSQDKEGYYISHTYTRTGTYNVVLEYNDGICGVVTATTGDIVVYENPKASFYIPNDILISDEKIQLYNQSTTLANNKYDWKVGSKEYTDVNPIITFDKVGTYKVTLVASTINNCKDSTWKFVNVYDEFRIYVPKSFTPNYDGLNDVFYPVIHFGKKYYLFIFDRWGEMIYQAENGKWDGTYKGQEVKEDTYVWKINVWKEDGSIIEKTGHITLLK